MGENTNIKFEDWEREQMKDPWFRFWTLWPTWALNLISHLHNWWVERGGDA